MDLISIDNCSNYIEKFKDFYREYSSAFENIATEIKSINLINVEKELIRERILRLKKELRVYEDEMKVKGADGEKWLELRSHREFLGRVGGLREGFEASRDALQLQVAMATKNIVPNETNIVLNPHLIHCRQTNKPFTVEVMSPNSRYKCNGCNETIHLQDIYLNHMEEYPAGSKILRPHSYHIKKDCFHRRGFQDMYLSNIKVIYNTEVDEDAMKCIKNIGFLQKNILKADDYDSDASDATSHNSEASQNLTHRVTFIYRRKHTNQKKVIMCTSCKEEIATESFLTLGGSFVKSFHIHKKCIKFEELLSDDFSSVKCKVFKMLRSHNEIKELTACGFHFKNIIGYKPPNPNLKTKPIGPTIPIPHSIRPLPKDIIFIFNDEPFTCEKLIHNERCSGCHEQVRKDDMVLRHKERIPRDRLTDTPLISQFYHSIRNCLMDRGFSDKYLESSICNVILSGSDSLPKIRDLIIRCGFASNKINFITTDGRHPQEIKTNFGGYVEKGAAESYLFIVSCKRLNSYCEGCRLEIIPNDPCFIYGLNSIQDMKARLFHIKDSCLLYHFSKSQILSLTCINNNSMVDVDPRNIVKCGIVNIKTSIPNQTKLVNNDRPKFNPFQSNLPRFIVEKFNATRFNGMCFGCNSALSLDKYVLQCFNSNERSPIYMHISQLCLRKCGHFPQQLSKCNLTLSIRVSPLILQRLEECGFKIAQQ